METLTTQETARRQELEKQIETNISMVGRALFEIRESRLYRTTHATFEDYCQDRFAMSRSYINMQIKAAAVVENLATNSCQVLPKTETQARPLAKLPAEQQPAAWERAQEKAKEEGKPVAARHVEAAVDEVMPKKEPGPEPDPFVVDGTQNQTETQKKERVNVGAPCSAMSFWGMARSQLQRINKADKERVQALEACIKYCQERISNKK